MPQFDANGNPIGSAPTQKGQPAENTMDAAVQAAQLYVQRNINAGMGILNVVTMGLIPATKISLGSFEEAKPKGTNGIMDAKINPGAATLSSRGSNAANGVIALFVRDHQYLQGSDIAEQFRVCGNIGPVTHVDTGTIVSPLSTGGGGGGGIEIG